MDAGSADLRFFHVTDSGAGADRNLSKNKHLKTGDIVAFWQGNKLLVKRVIAGLAVVDIDAGGVVTVDGQTIDEPYLKEVSLGNCDIELPHQVAESHWFFMGDNRATSVDSRTASIGDVSEDQIEGRSYFGSGH